MLAFAKWLHRSGSTHFIYVNLYMIAVCNNTSFSDTQAGNLPSVHSVLVTKVHSVLR